MTQSDSALPSAYHRDVGPGLILLHSSIKICFSGQWDLELALSGELLLENLRQHSQRPKSESSFLGHAAHSFLQHLYQPPELEHGPRGWCSLTEAGGERRLSLEACASSFTKNTMLIGRWQEEPDRIYMQVAKVSIYHFY